MRKKSYLDKNVYEESLDRIRYLYDSFDKIVVSFSGGKDSTAVLNMALEVAKEKDQLPLKVVFFDEEAIHPPTIEYVKRVYDRPDVDLEWYCLEFKHRNACSNEEPYWYTWDQDKKDLWTRDLPKEAITEHSRFQKGMSFQEFSPYLYDKTHGRIAMLTGIRSQESIRRFQMIAKKKNDAYINSKSEARQNQYRAHPVYDWSSEDIWIAVNKFNWDYNKTYDIYNKTKLYNKFLAQRVCPPYGEEPLRNLWIYSECFPEMWHKMIARVPGAATAYRYGNSELYSSAKTKPEGMSWQDYAKVITDSYSNVYKNKVRKTINDYMKLHKRRTNMAIPQEDPHPVTGLSWKWLCKVALRGDMKGRLGNQLNNEAVKKRDELGITLTEARKQYA